MILETVIVGALQTNCYVLGCERTGRAIVVDPGDDPSDILEVLRRHRLTLDRLVLTHAHFDHVLAARPLQDATGAPLYLAEADRFQLTFMRRTTISWIGDDPGEPPVVNGDLGPGTPLRIPALSRSHSTCPGVGS